MIVEADLQRELIRFCQIKGWLVHACWDGWHCDGKGFPDVVVASHSNVVWIELKAHSTSRVRPEQTGWKYTLQAAGEHYKRWTIADWVNGYAKAELQMLLG